MLFSIVIPVYNVAPYLRECLDSVLAQTFTDWEAICVDDGSTDGSGAILDEYAARDSRFRVIHKDNAGVSAARNDALKRISGEWVMFLDSDDVLTTCDALHLISRNVYSCDNKVALAFNHKEFFDGESVPSVGTSSISRTLNIDTSVNSDIFRILLTSSVLPATVVKGKRFPFQRVGEDLIFLNEVLAEINKVVFLDFILYGYRTRMTSVTHSRQTFKKFQDITRLNNFWLTHYESKGKTLSRDACEYISQWLYCWNIERLKTFKNDEYIAANDSLLRLYKKLSALKNCPMRYKISCIVGVLTHSAKIGSICSGRFPRPHFGLVEALQKFRMKCVGV